MSNIGPSLHGIFPNEVIYMFLSHLSQEQRIGVQRVSLLWRFLGISLLKDFVKREYPFLITDVLTDSDYVALFENQKRIYSALAKENNLPLWILEKRYLEALASGRSVSFPFTPKQAIFLKEMIVATGIREDGKNLDKGNIFELMAEIGNAQKLKEWDKKNDLPYDCALLIAAKNGHLPCVHYLLEKESLAISTGDTRTAWRMIKVTDHLGHAGRYKIDNGYGHNILACSKGQGKDIALKLAAENGHTACVAYLIKAYGKMIDIDNKKGALLRAAKNGHLGCMRYLIEQCGEEIADLDKLDNDNVWNQSVQASHHNTKAAALISAARGGHIECVKYLIEGYGKEMDFLYKKDAFDSAKGECKEYLWECLNPVLYGLTYLFDALVGRSLGNVSLNERTTSEREVKPSNIGFPGY